MFSIIFNDLQHGEWIFNEQTYEGNNSFRGRLYSRGRGRGFLGKCFKCNKYRCRSYECQENPTTNQKSVHIVEGGEEEDVHEPATYNDEPEVG